jgi:hypothetical protein
LDFTDKVANYDEITLECQINGNFIDFTDDELGDKWIDFRNNYNWNNYEDLTLSIQKDFPNADGIIFSNKHMIVVWYPKKSINLVQNLNKI